MTHRQWFMRAPSLCAIAIMLLIFGFYTSDLKTVVRWPAAQSSSAIHAPASGDAHSEHNAAENGIRIDEPSEPLHTPTSGDTSGNSTTLEDFEITSLPPGVILSAELREITTTNRSHSLRLEDDGNVALYRFVGTSTAQNDTQLLWSLGISKTKENTEHVLRLSEDGVVTVVELVQHEEQPEEQPEEQVLWHSNLLPECMTTPTISGSSIDPPSLNIMSNGEVVIHGRCALFTPSPKSTGKLAILVSGLYRTNALTCNTHIQYLAENPAAESVDIFAYVLYEPGDIHDDVTIDTIEADIRQCYGPFLRTLTLKSVDELSEEFPGELMPRCGSKLNRLHMQLKTLYLGGKEWWDWAVAQGIKHHTVLRIRTDHEFFGDTLPSFKPVDELKGNELVLAPIAGGAPVPLVRHWFCSNPFGRMDVAISDQLAYGRPSAMHFFLTMYQNFADVIAMAVPENKGFRESWLCLAMPKGPEIKDCDQPEFCTIECALSWYLQSWDIEVSVNWNWPFRIRRG